MNGLTERFGLDTANSTLCEQRNTWEESWTRVKVVYLHMCFRMLRHWSGLVCSSWLLVWQWETTNTAEAGTLLSIAYDRSVFEGRLCVVSVTLKSKLILRRSKDEYLIYAEPWDQTNSGSQIKFLLKNREYTRRILLIGVIEPFRAEGEMVEWWLAEETDEIWRKFCCISTYSIKNVTWYHPSSNPRLHELIPACVNYCTALNSLSNYGTNGTVRGPAESCCPGWLLFGWSRIYVSFFSHI
jgi:hypothetical protein